MEIAWYGHACFRLKADEATVITDPYPEDLGYRLPRARADVVTVSHDHPNHSYLKGIEEPFKVVQGPGEYEINDVFIYGIPTFHDRQKGRDRGKNTIYLFEFEDLTVCHLGDLGHVPTQSQVEILSDVDVVLIPVGGHHTISAGQAAEVINLLEPRVVVPMHYKTDLCQIKLDPLEKFLTEMGLKEVEPQDLLNATKSRLPSETQVVVLTCKQ